MSAEFDEQVREVARKACVEVGPVRFEVPNHDSGETIVRRLIGLLSLRQYPIDDDAPTEPVAFVVMREDGRGLAYTGVHTEQEARDLEDGFDDVEVRRAEDVIRELCERVKALEAGQ